jgi:hypothetical protein
MKKSREGNPLQNDVSLYNLQEEGEGRPSCCKETISRTILLQKELTLYCTVQQEEDERWPWPPHPATKASTTVHGKGERWQPFYWYWRLTQITLFMRRGRRRKSTAFSKQINIKQFRKMRKKDA